MVIKWVENKISNFANKLWKLTLLYMKGKLEMSWANLFWIYYKTRFNYVFLCYQKLNLLWEKVTKSW